MQFKMRNVYCVRYVSPFVIIYFLKDSCTRKDIVSHLVTCSAEAINQIRGFLIVYAELFVLWSVRVRLGYSPTYLFNIEQFTMKSCFLLNFSRIHYY